jgi:translocator protein
MNKYILLLCSIIAVALTTYFSLLPLAGVTQADISDLYFSKITPAGFTFSIWSIIYLAWLGLGILQIMRKEKAGKKSLFLSCSILLTVLWLIPWHFGFIATSFLIMLLILFILFSLYSEKKYERYFQMTLELTLGWILVATIANFHALLIAYDVYFFPIIFTLISLALWLFVNIRFIQKRESYIPAFVYIWALFGIIVAQNSPVIQASASLCILILLGIMAGKYRVFQKKKKKK